MSMTESTTASTPATLDEASLRRPDFRPGTPIRFADGSVLQARRPALSFAPADTPEGFEVLYHLDGDDDGYNDLIDRRETLLRDTEAGRGAELIAVELAIAERLVGANYQIPRERLARLIRLGYDPEGNPEATRLREQLMAVAYGRPLEGLDDGAALAVPPDPATPPEPGPAPEAKS